MIQKLNTHTHTYIRIHKVYITLYFSLFSMSTASRKTSSIFRMFLTALLQHSKHVSCQHVCMQSWALVLPWQQIVARIRNAIMPLLSGSRRENISFETLLIASASSSHFQTAHSSGNLSAKSLALKFAFSLLKTPFITRPQKICKSQLSIYLFPEVCLKLVPGCHFL